MSTPSPIRITAALSAEHRTRLMSVAHEVNFVEGTRIFSEGGPADRFWIVRTGTVTLDVKVPGTKSAVIESLGPGELVGWSWLFRPYTWHFGAEAMTPVRTHEFDAAAVRMMMDADPAFGSAIGHWVGQVLAHRLLSARIRLLDLYAPHGSGSTL
ncbi:MULTISPECIES: cyclic nucleotide-binding domain-containing protein [Streptomyces]|uniref:cyclic nucleotide-binding domain-containing protein n=1 Tax=Streptomyces TaxID=1883 RepID=UPI00017F0CEB|nr:MULTISPECIES: cyclic nucleotide-binding domain-containing protein [Streptomyces]AKL64457.1 regulator [Streptomyces sp. Mg1]RPK42882.1 cAMP receptor protein [Streptomyces sp. ADI91-18]WBY18294.1 cyclic nucleotide-binding domain-containing protein [Streptomyces goshikiensis]WSR96984.1 cyclic nucleotide-binding domain-containing protein [Streptomyces goshikiensis]